MYRTILNVMRLSNDLSFHPAGDEGEDEARVDVKVSSYSQPGSTGKRARGSTLLCTGCPLEVMLSVQTVTPPPPQHPPPYSYLSGRDPM